MNTSSLNKLYLLPALLGIIYLNSYKYIIICSLIFSILSFSINKYAANTSVKQAIVWLAILAIGSIALNNKINSATIYSLCSVIISISLGLVFAKTITPLTNSPLYNHKLLLSILFSAVIDSMMVGFALISTYTIQKTLYIVGYDILYKVSYSTCLYLILNQLSGSFTKNNNIVYLKV